MAGGVLGPIDALVAVIVAVTVGPLLWRAARLEAAVKGVAVKVDAVDRQVNHQPPSSPTLQQKVDGLVTDLGTLHARLDSIEVTGFRTAERTEELGALVRDHLAAHQHHTDRSRSGPDGLG